MDKPANVILQFDKSKDFMLSTMVRLFEKKKFLQGAVDGDTLVSVDVNGFSLDDHQFIRIKVDFVGKAEAVIWIPRNFVAMILEGKADLQEAFSFAGSKNQVG